MGSDKPQSVYFILRTTFCDAIHDGGTTGMFTYLSTLVKPSAHYAVVLASAAKSALGMASLLSAENSITVDKIASSAVSPQALLELARET